MDISHKKAKIYENYAKHDRSDVDKNAIIKVKEKYFHSLGNKSMYSH